MNFNHGKVIETLAEFKKDQISSNEKSLLFLEGFSANITHDFQVEEIAMRQEEYPLCDYHSSLHNDFRKNLEDLKVSAKAEVEGLKEKITDSCSLWLEKHIEEENQGFLLFCSKENLVTDKDFEGCVLEVLQKNNDMIGTGIINLITNNMIEIRNKGVTPLPMLPNEVVKLNVFSPQKGFKVWIGRTVFSDIDQLVVTNVELLTEGNKRTFFRVKTDIKAKLEVVDKDRNMISIDSMNLSVKVLDVSIGGLMFETDQIFEIEDKVIINMELYKEEAKLECVVVRVRKEGNLYKYGCKFFDYSLRQGDVLARFVVDHQRAMALRAR